VVVKQVVITEDGSVGIRSLVSRETPLAVDDLTTPSHQRWPVECSPKSLKQTGSVAQSPPHTVTTQTTHFVAALWGFIQWERLKMRTKLNHCALKATLYLNALRSAFATLRTLTPVRGSA
jgi:hypothetical protein